MANLLEQYFSLAGKVCLVTGATRGLGHEIAMTLAGAGAHLVINATNAQKLEETADEITRATGMTAVGVAGDISDPSVSEEMVHTATSRWGHVDVVVNNAGINIRGAIETTTPEDFDRTMAVNVRGPWLLCRAAAPHFKSQRRGRVINIASTLGLVARSERSLYCTSKGAVIQLTRELAVEWADLGVTVNAICPGPFKTEMNRTLFENPESSALFAGYTAMKRWGEPGEMGPAVLFLASDAASYITGAILPVDGGWVVKS